MVVWRNSTVVLPS